MKSFNNSKVYSLLQSEIRNGYIIHGTNKEFSAFDPSTIQGGFRAKEGYGFYFTDTAYKAMEYGHIYKKVKKGDFNFLEGKAPIHMEMFDNPFEADYYRIYELMMGTANLREYEFYESQLEILKKKMKQFGNIFEIVQDTIKRNNLKNFGSIEYYLNYPDENIPKLIEVYKYYDYDGYHCDNVYTIFNFDKLNQLVEDVVIPESMYESKKNKVRQGIIPYEADKFEIGFEGNSANNYAHVCEDIDISSFKTQNTLNPNLWKNEKLDSRIRLKLLDIADDFTDFLNVDWVQPEDIIMTGSLTNYNWSEEFSDIDLHIIIDYKKVDKRLEFVKEYFKSKKDLWNQQHQDIKIFGFPVELYVQDKSEPHVSNGVYSLEKNKWLEKPSRKEPKKSDLKKAEKAADKWATKLDKLMARYYPNKTDSEKESILNSLDNAFNTIKNNRRKGFNNGGDEMNRNNLTFKILRRNGYLDKVWDKKTEIYDNLMSINEGTEGSDVIIIYHRVDWDGYTSAAIALAAYPHAKLYGWNYGDPLPDVSLYDTVILVDLTLSNKNDYSWMYENADKLIWIDHHSNAISQINDMSIKGVRKDGIGACVLTWQYFFPGQNLPAHVALCGTYDVFRKDGKYADWEDAWAYQLALSQFGPGSTKEGDQSRKHIELANEFIVENPKETLERIDLGMQLEHNRHLEEEKRFTGAQFVQRNGITICKLIADGQPAMLIKTNSDRHTADLFAIRSTKPLKGDDSKYKVSFRVPENSEVDASKIARKFGGNGHTKAAGCIMTQEEFDNL